MKKLDICLLVLFPIISVLLSLWIRANFLGSTLLFFGLPSFYFSWRRKDLIKKTAIFSGIVGFGLGVLVDYIGTIDEAWFVPHSVFPFRIFGVTPLENLIWAFFMVYYIVLFYEYFVDGGRKEVMNKRIKYLILILTVAILVFLVLMAINSQLLAIPYSYLWIGVVCGLIPVVTFLSFFPRLISKYVRTASYFSLLFLMYELTGLRLGQWTFPGKNFIGWVQLLGYQFPFEELIFWIILSAVTILTYYEFFADDRK